MEKFETLLDDGQSQTFDELMSPTLSPDEMPYEERETPSFDVEDAKRWVVARAYQLGWTKDLFARDRYISDASRSRPKLERIGKKYQWLALSELQARLSDNVWSLKEYPKESTVYDHPADSWYVRDVDPSLLIDTPNENGIAKWWLNGPKLVEDFDGPVCDWPFAKAPATNANWINVSEPDGKDWLLLYGFAKDRREREKKGNVVTETDVIRDCFVRITTVVVKAHDADRLVAALKGERLADPPGHETADWTDGPYLMEYPWRNTWDFREAFEEGWRPFEGFTYLRPVARHVWESHLDLSLSDGSSVCLPHPWIGRELSVRPDMTNTGTYVDQSGDVLFRDPAYGTDEMASLVADPTVFFKFLEKHSLECIWIVAGERNSYPSGHYSDFHCRSFASLHRLKNGKWVSEAWHSDTSGHKSNVEGASDGLGESADATEDQ